MTTQTPHAERPRLPASPYDPGMPGLEPLARLLDAAENAAPVDAVSAVTREVGLRLQATSVSFLVADTSGRALVRLTHVPLPRDSDRAGSTGVAGHRAAGEESAQLVPFDGGPLEQVVRNQRPLVLPPDSENGQDGWTALAPVTEGGEVIGVLELLLPEEPSKEDTAEITTLAHLLAFVTIANRRHTDLFEWGHRSRPLSLSAEIQQRLLPGARTCEAGAFTLSAWLEPAAEIAGDTFDYSLGRNTLYFSITDAMGHGVGAALTATLCVAALRGSRRTGQTLTQQAHSASSAVLEHGLRSGYDDFVTGLVGRVDLKTGALHLINAGHVPPYLARGGEVRPIVLPANLPFGIYPDTVYETADVALQPGDRVVFLTDGMLERNAATLDLPAAIRQVASLHPREAAPALADAVLEATGHALSDDATVLCLDWYGGHGQDRVSRGGVDPSRVSSPAG